jgi:Lipocalin-like domain
MLRLRALAALVMMSVLVSCVGAQDRATIVGTWKVTSYEIEFQDNGERLSPLGAHPHGYGIFTPQGRAMFYLEAEGRKAPTTAAEAVEAYRTLNAYTGKYRVEGNKWITKVDGAWNVEWVGTEQERTFDLKGNRLNVTTPWILSRLYGGRLLRGYLTFERED